jgi:FlgN protein
MTSLAEHVSPNTLSPNAEELFQSLSVAVRAESLAARALRAALLRKQKALIECELAGLHILAEEAIAASGLLSAAEAECLRCIEALQGIDAVPSDLPACAINAGLLGDLMPPALAGPFSEAVAELAAELALVSEINLHNEALLKNLLNYTQMAVRLIAGQDGADTYTRRGGVDSGAARKLVDSRV